jgi:D-proline reductase (dithiol) PrdB
MADQDLRDLVGEIPVPDMEPAAVTAPPLNEATVAIVTTAGLRPSGEVAIWQMTDASFTVLPKAARDVQLSHFSPNFDRSGIGQDLNVVYPVDRIDEMVADGVIGRAADTNLSFMGAQVDLSTIIQDTGPAAAQVLLDQEVDIVLLTPV